MSGRLDGSYIYENLKTIYIFNESTRLCIYEPTHKLYVVKTAQISCKPHYEKIAAANNPHIAGILYIEDKGNCVETVREYISGDTLADIIKGGRTLPEERATAIAADICDGLAALHELGYVHRDINPNNIVILEDGSAKIIDFGIARSFSENKSADTVILGTPGYAAPEQFGFSQSNAATDIYAVGVLLNVMLTGDFPNRRLVKGELEKVITRCTEIDARQRYASVAELKNAIQNKKAGGNLLDRIIRQIPGIRSSKTHVIILSVIGYIMAVIFCIAAFSTVKNGAYAELALSLFFSLPVPVIFFNNVFDLWNKLPFSKGATKKNQKILYKTIGSISIFIGVILFGLANQ